MAVCICCGEDDFECVDGLYYCTTCQTQSLDQRVEVQEDEFLATVPSLQLREKSRITPSRKKVVDKGRPWTSPEAFTLIMKQQVKTLIQKGADKRLDDIVLRLWVCYLQKCDVAFKEEHDKNSSSQDSKTSNTMRRERDMYLGTIEDPTVKAIRTRFSKQKASKGLLSRKQSDQQKRKNDLAETISGETFYEGDNPLDGMATDQGTENVQRMLSEEESFQSQKKPNIYMKSDYMTLSKTVAFCQLGLLFTGSLCMPGDLHRLIRMGILPYNNANQILPTDMKMGHRDFNTFMLPSAATVDHIRQEVGRLFIFMDLGPLPKLDIIQLASRYVMDLNLPGELHSILYNLGEIQHFNIRYPWPSQKTKLKKSGYILPNFSALAVAYIIICLKMLFGLDDVTEIKLTKYARELSQVMNLGEQLFVWADWVAASELRMKKNRSSLILGHPPDSSDVEDVAHFADLSGTNIQGKMRKALVSRFHEREETRQNVQQPLKQLLEKVETREAYRIKYSEDSSAAGKGNQRSQKGTILFPNPTMESDPLENLCEDTDSYEVQLNPVKSFQATSLRYLTDDGFLDSTGGSLLDHTILSSCVESSSDGEDTQETQDSFFHNSTKRHKKPSRVHLAVRKLLMEKKHGSHSSARPHFRPGDFEHSLVRASEKYVVYEGQMPSAMRHKSYTWLLGVCAELIHSPPSVIDYLVCHLETLILLPPGATSYQKKMSMIGFRTHYFDVRSKE